MNIICGLENETYKAVFGINNAGGINRFRAPFSVNESLTMVCAKNDWAAAQLLLFSESEMLVCVSNETCFYEEGPIDIIRVEVDVPGVEPDNVSVQLVGLVEDDDRQKKSDILFNKPFIYVEPRKTQPVWIEVRTGRNMHAGKYKAFIKVLGHRLFEDEQFLKTLSFDIEVLDIDLGDPTNYSFYLDLWQHNSNIARKYDVELWSDKHFEILRNYILTLADLGQKAITLVASEIPWSGQYSCYAKDYCSNLFEYNIVNISKNREGKWNYDFSILNRYVRLCMECGIDQEIEVFGLINVWTLEDAGYGKVIEDYPDAVRIRYYDEECGSFRFMRKKKEFESYVKALESNFINNGWIDRVRIVADEPADIKIYKKRISEIRNIAPSFRYKAALNHVSLIEEQIEGITDYVPILTAIWEDYDKLKNIKDKISGKFLFYVCCGPKFPNTFIHSPLVESRLIPWLAYYLGLDGFLRWSYTAWPNDPLTRISYLYPMLSAGDTNFVYPGKDGKPILSLRYKNLKRGIRDFEILKMYEKKAGKDKLLEELQNVFKVSMEEWKEDSRRNREELYSLSYNDYESIIVKALREIT